MGKRVKFFIRNLEEEMKNDIEKGNGFIIQDRTGIIKKVVEKKDRATNTRKRIKKSERADLGIYSPKFGSIWGDENAFEELYSCECGELLGNVYTGVTCPLCGTEVKFKDKNIHMTGYFNLTSYKIIHPTLYKILGSLIGGKRLNMILKADWKTVGDGNPEKPIIDEKTKNIKKYDRIGLGEFINRFDEILDFFYNKRKDKKMEYDFIKENRDSVFTSVLPVITLFLRPIILGDEDYGFALINRKYMLLSAKIYDLNHKFVDNDPKQEKIIMNTLYKVQTTYDSVLQIINDSMNKKQGLIRNDLLGFRSNFATRAVITPLAGTKSNEVHFPYLGFLEMYRPEIINILTKIMDITVNEAYLIWLKATVKFDQRVYNVMEYMVTHSKVYILLNRNPTINYGGILRMRIVKVKPIYDDLTISIPINILKILAADFDGDKEFLAS